LQIRSVEPEVGSVGGGTKLTIDGRGFGYDGSVDYDDIEIVVGHGECEIESLSSDQIICEIKAPGETHDVTNSGTSAGLSD